MGNHIAMRDEWRKLRAENKELWSWSLKVNGRLTRSIGRAVYTTNTVEMSRGLMNQPNPDYVIDVLRHEAAHAIVGPGKGHGWEWKARARELGCRDSLGSCASAAISAAMPQKEHKWVVRCLGCFEDVQRTYSKPRRNFASGRYSCVGCGSRDFRVRRL